MKKCPFCYEEIQIEAIKCKHCGEMLNKTSIIRRFTGVVNDSIDKVKKYQNEKIKERFSHLTIPTENSPIILGDIKFYKDYYVTINNLKVDYNKINFIISMGFSESVNGFESNQEFEFAFIPCGDENNFAEGANENRDEIVEVKISRTFLNSKKLIEQAYFIVSYVQSYTFEKRLNRYYKFLEKEGSIILGIPYFIDNVGNILDHNKKFLLNFNEKYSKNLVEYGTEWSTIKGSSQSNPYTLKIYYNNRPSFKLLNLDFNDKISVEILTNKDVIDFILINLLKNGYIVKNNAILVEEEKNQILFIAEDLTKIDLNDDAASQFIISKFLSMSFDNQFSIFLEICKISGNNILKLKYEDMVIFIINFVIKYRKILQIIKPKLSEDSFTILSNLLYSNSSALTLKLIDIALQGKLDNDYIIIKNTIFKPKKESFSRPYGETMWDDFLFLAKLIREWDIVEEMENFWNECFEKWALIEDIYKKTIK